MTKILHLWYQKFAFFYFEMETMLLLMGEYLIQRLKVGCFIFPTHKDIINVTHYPRNALKHCIHNHLKKGWCGGYSERKVCVGVQPLMGVDSDIVKGSAIQEQL